MCDSAGYSTFDPLVVVEKTVVKIPPNCNQVTELVKYATAVIFSEESKLRGGDPCLGLIEEEVVFHRLKLFHTDSVICGLSAIAQHTRAPLLLRQEALEDRLQLGDERKHQGGVGALVFGSSTRVPVARAVAANCAAVREWDANGTNFGFDSSDKSRQAGEFGHNDYYPVVIAAAQHSFGVGTTQIDGRTCLRAMLVLDEIRYRLAEVFPLKDFKIDHVLHGGIACAVVYGVLLRGSMDVVESAVGMLVSHYTPWRSIRAGDQLSDSKGSSAGFIAEAAVNCVHRALRGFRGPVDIFRNPAGPFRVFKPTFDDESPFNLALTHSGVDFAIMKMHLKFGLYALQSASAIQIVVKMLAGNPDLLLPESTISEILVYTYKDAVDIIAGPAKRTPKTRQSADHSLVYIVARILHKARSAYLSGFSVPPGLTEAWKMLMLLPDDYSPSALENLEVLELMNVIRVKDGGPEYNDSFPEGIPARLKITYHVTHEPSGNRNVISIMPPAVKYPVGHASSPKENAAMEMQLLTHKHEKLGMLALEAESQKDLVRRLNSFETATAQDVQSIYSYPIRTIADIIVDVL